MPLRFLVEILFVSAIQCEDKQKYICKIMTELDHEAQVCLSIASSRCPPDFRITSSEVTRMHCSRIAGKLPTTPRIPFSALELILTATHT